MIEVNLLPGAKRRRKRRTSAPSLSLPSFDNLPDFDRWIAFIAVAWVIGPLVGGWMYFGARAEQAGLQAEIDRAAQDSARYTGVIEATRHMQAQRDSIAERLQLIQEIDADRYVWAHILDEVGRALPDYTWLSDLFETRGEPLPTIRVSGYTATMFALTRFMTDLEASPFLRTVKLVSSELVGRQGELVYRFSIDAEYEEPPADFIEMQPFIILEDSSGAAPD